MGVGVGDAERILEDVLQGNDDSYEEEGSILLLAAYRPVPEPVEWNLELYTALAEELGRLHAIYWDRTEPLDELSWLRRHQREDLLADREQAYKDWKRLGEEERFQSVLTPERMREIGRLLGKVEQMEAICRAFPLTLCHGDCHIDNLLLDEAGKLVWADWQEVGIGAGPEDLSFCFQRASAAGAEVPLDRMIQIYHSSLQATVDRPISPKAILQVVQMSELKTRLVYWPAYLTHVSTAALDNFAARIFELATEAGI